MLRGRLFPYILGLFALADGGFCRAGPRIGKVIAGDYRIQIEIANGGAADGFTSEFSLRRTVVSEPQH